MGTHGMAWGRTWRSADLPTRVGSTHQSSPSGTVKSFRRTFKAASCGWQNDPSSKITQFTSEIGVKRRTWCPSYDWRWPTAEATTTKTQTVQKFVILSSKLVSSDRKGM